MVFRSLPFPETCFLTLFHGVDFDVSIDAIVALAKQKNKMVFSSEDLVLIKVLRREIRLRQLMNDHTAALEITGNM